MAAPGTRLLKVEIGATEYSVELTNARFSAADTDNDTITFADAAAGGAKDWFFNFTAIQDPSASTIWSQIFDNAGDDVAITYMPYGNAVPSATQPHFTATATIAQFDGDFLGGEANASPTAKWTFDSSWKCAAKPAKVTAP